MTSLKVRKIGKSLGTTLPQELTQRLNVAEGDILYLTETPEGYLLTPYDPEFSRQMAAARSIMERRGNVLRALAK